MKIVDEKSNLVLKELNNEAKKIKELILKNNSTYAQSLVTQLNPNQVIDSNQIKNHIRVKDNSSNQSDLSNGFKYSVKLKGQPNYNLTNGSVDVILIIEKDSRKVEVNKVLSGFRKLNSNDIEIKKNNSWDISKTYPSDLKASDLKIEKGQITSPKFEVQIRKSVADTAQVLKFFNIEIEVVNYKNYSGQVDFNVKLVRNTSSKNSSSFSKVITGFKREQVRNNKVFYSHQNQSSYGLGYFLTTRELIDIFVKARNNNDTRGLVDSLLEQEKNNLPDFKKLKEFYIKTTGVDSQNENQMFIFGGSQTINTLENFKNKLIDFINENTFFKRKNIDKNSNDFKTEFEAKNDKNHKKNVLLKYYDLEIPKGYTFYLEDNAKLSPISASQSSYSAYELEYKLKKGSKVISKRTILGYVTFVPIEFRRIFDQFWAANFLKTRYLSNNKHWLSAIVDELKQIKFKASNNINTNSAQFSDVIRRRMTIANDMLTYFHVVKQDDKYKVIRLRFRSSGADGEYINVRILDSFSIETKHVSASKVEDILTFDQVNKSQKVNEQIFVDGLLLVNLK
nr:lipoprotein 17-related variable surface protein [Mycoplasmopsis pulmonis]